MELQTDIHKINIGSEGIDGFYWPISMTEHTRFGYDLIASFCAIVRERDGKNAEIYKCMGQPFVSEAIGIFQGDLLKKRCRADNVVPLANSDWRLWPYLLAGKAPDEAPFIKSLRQGPNQKISLKKRFSLERFKRVFKAFNFKKEGFSISGMKLKHLSDEVLRCDIISCQRTGMIERHAGAVRQDVVFSRSFKWFSAIDDNCFEQAAQSADHDLESGIMDAVAALYKKNGIALPAYSKAYLVKFLGDGCCLLRAHYDRLLAIPVLPKHLWIGSSGNIWDRVLASAVRASGGVVEAHDHAMGQGVYGLPITSFIEFWGIDCFWTYNVHQKARLLENNGLPWALRDHHMPEIKSLDSSNASSPDIKRLRLDKPRKTVAVMSTIYDCDRGRIDPVPPNIVSVDWQARLISRLKSWGYDVVLKIHPESPINPPRAFAEKLGCRIVAERFENVIQDFDIVLFDYIYTTTFRTVLESDLPVVVTDYYDIQWSPGVEPLIEKRCEIVKGEVNQDNRVMFDWEALRKACEESIRKTDNNEFLDKYLG